MPRRKKDSDAVSTKQTVQQLNDEQQQALFFDHKKAYEKALAVKKEADAKLKNACKLAKSELGDQAVAMIKATIEFETDEGEAAVRAKLEATLRAARWMGAAIGSQFEMFEGPDRTPAADRAFEEGKRAGMKGEPARPPYAPELEQYRRWMEGHGVGNEALARKGFKATAAAGDEHIERVSKEMSGSDAVDSLVTH